MNNSNEKKYEIDILVLISILLKNIKFIIITTAIGMIGIVIISIVSLKLPPNKSFLPNFYTPQSTIMLNSSSGGGSNLESMLSSSGLGALAGLSGFSGGTSLNDGELAIKLAHTNNFIDKLSKKFDLDKVYKSYENKTPRTYLRSLIKSKLVISSSTTPGMLTIAYTDIDKELATNIVNEATNLLEEEFSIIDRIRNSDQTLVVEEKIAIVEEEMNRLQNEIILFQVKHNILDVEVVSAEVVKLISELQSQLLSKEVQIESYGKFANDRDPVYIKLLNEKDAILNAIMKLEKGEVGDYPPIEELPKLALTLAELKRMYEVQLIGYKALIQQSETLKLTAEGTGPIFQVLENAEIPEVKSGPSRGKLCIIVSIIFFLLSIVFVLSREFIFVLKNDPEKMARLRGKDA